MLHTWVLYFEFFRSRKGWQNLFQKHEIPVRNIFLAKSFWSQCHILRIIYVLYMYYICIICVLYVFLLALSGFSWVFCVRGDFCLCFCWLFLGFWCPRRFLYGGRHANDAVDHSLLWQPHHWQSSAERCKTPRRPANDTVCHGPRRQPYHSHASAAFSDPWNCRARPVNDTEAAGAQCEVCCGTQSRLNGNPAP